MKKNIKEKLYASCLDYAKQRIDNAQSAIESAQASANSETKSTAGDKHDTARAMMQLAAEQNAKHLAEANKLQKAMHQVNPESNSKEVKLGSLVIASNGNFYISVSAGKIELDDAIYYAISPTSPMAQVLNGLSAGDETKFNQMKITVKEVL